MGEVVQEGVKSQCMCKNNRPFIQIYVTYVT